MCISPSFVWIERGPKWEQTPVPCKICWRCKQNRVNDYVGRSLAEAKVSVATCAITLTYAPRDDLADKVLTPYHFQLFMKLLRRAGHKVRYLVAGEFGELKGRAHFHAILFFTHVNDAEPCEVPEYDKPFPFCHQIPSKRMVHIREWPHGHIKVDWSANEAAVRYVCKYLLSDDKNNAWFSLSKKPSIGAAWFAQKAATSVALGLNPFSFEYLPPGGSSEKSYIVTGATRRDYLNAIGIDPAVRHRLSEWVQKSFDKYRRKELVDFHNSFDPETVIAAMAERFLDQEPVTSKIYKAQVMRDLRIQFALHERFSETGSYINVETS
jgi:hypothetical protein